MRTVDEPRPERTGAAARGGIGKSVRRRENYRLLTGAGRFLDDIALAGFREAAFLRSPHAHARIQRISTTAARAVPGVLGVYTAAEVSRIQKPIPPKVTHPDLNHVPRFPLAAAEVRYVGEPVAVVVAVTRHVAEDAVELIEVEYEALPAVGTLEAALSADAPRVHLGSDHNIAIHLLQRTGNPDTALVEAPHRLQERFEVERGGSHSIETRAIAARFDPWTRQLVVWDTTQVPHYVRNTLSILYDLPEEEVRLIAPPDVGGGFGTKAQFHGEEAVIPWIAMQLGQPVKWVEDRAENFVAAMMERSQIHDVEVGFDDDGRIIALRDVFLHDQGAYCTGLQVPTITMSTIPGPYKIPNIHTELIACYTNMVPTSSVRGAGRPQAVVAMERMIDRIAEHLGRDPADVRHRNLVQRKDFPYSVGLTFRDGSPLTYDSGDFVALLDGALERMEYEAVRNEQLLLRDQGRYIGVGIAMYVEGSALGPYEGARVRLTNRGQIVVELAAAPQGQGYETVFAQIAAEAMQLDMDCIRVVTGDTSRIPFGQGTFASRITATAGSAVFEAAQQMRARIFEVAGTLLKVPALDLEFAGNRIAVRGGGAAVTLREVAEIANVGRHGIALPAGIRAGVETSSYFQPERAAYSSGVHVAVVEADPETGRIEVLSYVIGHDCGTVINPAMVEGQILGGYAHGIGNALLERPVYDDCGQPLTTSYLDYCLPSSLDVPPVQIFHVHSPSPLNPLGAKGAGEGGTIPVPAAIANAVEDALRPLGARITAIPVTPPRVLQAIYGDAMSAEAERDVPHS